jgi:hypothetical protein
MSRIAQGGGGVYTSGNPHHLGPQPAAPGLATIAGSNVRFRDGRLQKSGMHTTAGAR